MALADHRDGLGNRAVVDILVVVVGGENTEAVERLGSADTKAAADYYSPVAVGAGPRSSAWLRHCSALELVQALVELESEAGCV